MASCTRCHAFSGSNIRCNAPTGGNQAATAYAMNARLLTMAVMRSATMERIEKVASTRQAAA